MWHHIIGNINKVFYTMSLLKCLKPSREIDLVINLNDAREANFKIVVA